MSIIIDTPDGIDFARAASRAGALHMEVRGLKRSGRSVYSIVKDVYGFTGNKATVSAMLDDYVEGVLTVRKWSEAYGEKIADIAQEAVRRACEEYGPNPNLQQQAGSNVQAFFESGSITEQEGNDACLLIYVEVVRQHAGRR